MKLYEIHEAIAMLEEADPEGFTEALDDLHMVFADKVENICRLHANMRATADAYKAEADRMMACAKAMQNRASYLRAWLGATMIAMDKAKVKGVLFSATLQASTPHAHVTDLEAIPGEWRWPDSVMLPKEAPPDVLEHLKTMFGADALSYHVDARGIIDAWRKSGETLEVPGVEVLQDRHVVIRAGGMAD